MSRAHQNAAYVGNPLGFEPEPVRRSARLLLKHIRLDGINICRLTQADVFIVEIWVDESCQYYVVHADCTTYMW